MDFKIKKLPMNLAEHKFNKIRKKNRVGNV